MSSRQLVRGASQRSPRLFRTTVSSKVIPRQGIDNQVRYATLISNNDGLLPTEFPTFRPQSISVSEVKRLVQTPGNVIPNQRASNPLIMMTKSKDNGSGPSSEKSENNKKNENDTENEKGPEEKQKKEKSPSKDKEPSSPKLTESENKSGISSGSGVASGGDGNGGNNNGNGNDDDKGPSLLSGDRYPPLLAIAMKDKPPLPGRPFSINVSDKAVKEAIIEICDRREPHFVMFHMRDPEAPDTDIIGKKESVFDIGVHCYVQRYFEDGPYLRILGYPMERCRLEDLTIPTEEQIETEAKNEEDKSPTAYLKSYQVSIATISKCQDEPYDPESPLLRGLIEDVRGLLTTMARIIPSKKDTVADASGLLKSPNKLADFLGSTTSAAPSKIQEILEDFNIESRLKKAIELFRVELEAFSIADQTMREITTRADEGQTRQVVKEYIKSLLKNIGLDNEKSKVSKFDERLKRLKLSEEALEAYNTEKAKLGSNNEHNSEVAVTERYLDWLTSIPWGVFSKDRFEVGIAEGILDRDHYGLKDVKDRILEFISLAKVSGKVDGKILCLVGPPGTGKTSIARSIAEALHRRYVRIAMGGIHDVHEVKGHRRTYVGAIPGRIILALKQAKTSNPLMLIDEIDKLDLSRTGGAASAFLEILDPEQNSSFVDNYIDVSVNLSKVLFVCTANSLDTIPPPLLDRMEIIRIPGYTNYEKLEIAKQHLVPQAAKKAKLGEDVVTVSAEALSQLVEKYCRESGLRNVKKLINRIFSKASLKIVKQLEKAGLSVTDTSSKLDTTKESDLKEEQKVKDENVKEEEEEQLPSAYDAHEEVEPLKIPPDVKIEITPETLKDYVGPEIFIRDRVYDIPPPGVATGLSFRSSGNGDALYIESILTHAIGSGAGSGHGGIHVTGRLQEVMKESASIAYSYAKLFLVHRYPENRFFEAADIHIHCPDGATGKDGPSAGIAFTSSLLSLAFNEALPPNIAMTGEITLTGKVLPVGGLREKTLGAKRCGCDTIIFPKDIENELDEMQEEIKRGVKFIPVLWYSEVFDILFPNANSEKFSNVWKDEFKKLDEKKKKK